MTDIRDAIDREAEALELELHADPRFLKLKHLKELQALYSKEAAPLQRTVSAPTRSSRGASVDRARALAESAEFIRGRTAPTRTSEILSAIEQLGIEIGGESPVSNLSAMLSRSPFFVAHGRAGWTLVPEENDQSQNADHADDDVDEVFEIKTDRDAWEDDDDL